MGLVPVCAHAVPQRGLQGEQQFWLRLFEFLQGYILGVLVEQPGMLRLPIVAIPARDERRIWAVSGSLGFRTTDRECGTILVPVRACRIPECGLPWKQRRGVYMLEFLQGHAGGVVVEQPRVLWMRVFKKCNRSGRFSRLDWGRAAGEIRR